MKKKLSVVLAVFGRYEMQTYQLQQKIEEIKSLDKKIEVIVVLDGPRWMTAPMMQLLPMKIPSIKIVETKETTHLPSVLFNKGISQAKGDYIVFSTLYGINLTVSTVEFQRALNEQETKKEENDPVFYLKPCTPRAGVFLDQALYGQCQTSDSLHIDEWCIPRRLWEKLGGFHESPLLQEEFERYAALSFLRCCPSVCAGTLQEGSYSAAMSQACFEKRLVSNRDLARRFAIYCNAVALRQRSHEECSMQFLQDLPEDEMKFFARIEGIPANRDKNGKRYRVFVIGGHWEYHHNQIAFYNYFENLYGTGFATVNCGVDSDVQVPEIQGYDLVIFTRCRSEQGLALMEYCKKNHIPSVYMIDDNWISIAKDFPDVGGIFVPGNANYDNFIKALSLCKSTWLYSPILRQDVLPYTANVQKFPISVCASTFTAEESRKRRDDELYVGFSGSLRWNDVAFRALARLARRNKNVKVVLAGALSAEQEMLFTGLDVIRMPMTSYAEYAQNMARLQPDLLIAPLESTRTTRSKCANKYVEAGIVGAACIFSKTEPYLSVVKDGVNGYYVEEESDEGWYQKINAVLTDLPKLRKVQKRAQDDVRKNYAVEQLTPLFQKKITAIIEQEVLSDD